MPVHVPVAELLGLLPVCAYLLGVAFVYLVKLAFAYLARGKKVVVSVRIAVPCKILPPAVKRSIASAESNLI